MIGSSHQLEGTEQFFRRMMREKEMQHEGRKDDAGKPRWDLLPGDAVEEIVKVLTFGANKYSARNWEHGMKWGRCFRALMSHSWAWWRGEDKDPETGLSHMAHAGCCLLFLLSYELRNAGTDDRPKEFHNGSIRPDAAEPTPAVHPRSGVDHVRVRSEGG